MVSITLLFGAEANPSEAEAERLVDVPPLVAQD